MHPAHPIPPTTVPLSFSSGTGTDTWCLHRLPPQNATAIHPDERHSPPARKAVSNESTPWGRDPVSTNVSVQFRRPPCITGGTPKIKLKISWFLQFICTYADGWKYKFSVVTVSCGYLFKEFLEVFQDWISLQLVGGYDGVFSSQLSSKLCSLRNIAASFVRLLILQLED